MSENKTNEQESYLAAPGSAAKSYGATDDESGPSSNNASNNVHNNVSNNGMDMEEDDSDNSDSDDSEDSDDSDDEDGNDKKRHFTDASGNNKNGNSGNSNGAKNESKSNASSGKKASYKLLINDPSFLTEEGARYPDNIIVSSKYTIFTFIPLNLFEQFRRIANIYFLMIIAIQFIPDVTPFEVWTSIVPLAFILIVGAIKDGIEDWHRHQDDRRANALPILRLDALEPEREFVRTTSAQLKVGDIVLIKRGEEIPADCVVLSSDNKDGTCYISTASLDGENAPKPRRAIKATSGLKDEIQLSNLRGNVLCPNNSKSLHGFAGRMQLLKSSLPADSMKSDSAQVSDDAADSAATSPTAKDEYLLAKTFKDDGTGMDATERKMRDDYMTLSLGDDHFMYRGSKLVNTEYVHALVLFVGSQTKLMLNRNQVPFKFSKFEKTLNQCIASILAFNLVLCISFGLAANLVIEPFPELERDNWYESTALDTATWLVLTSWMIPFSLYVTMELVKMIQSQWIAWDENLVYWIGGNPIEQANNRANNTSIDSVESNSNTNHVGDAANLRGGTGAESFSAVADAAMLGSKRSARVKNSNLNEELGHIDYVFTDKTGTLTQNQMELCKCSIVGKKYQNDVRPAEAPSGNIAIGEDYSPLSEVVREVLKQDQRRRESAAQDTDEWESSQFFWNLLVCGATLPVAKHNVLNYMDLTEDMIAKQEEEEAVRRASQMERKQSIQRNSSLRNKPQGINEKQAVSGVQPDNDSKSRDDDGPSGRFGPAGGLGGLGSLAGADASYVEEEIEFMSPSPDEVAFAEALADHGVVLEERTATSEILVRLHPGSKHVRKKGAGLRRSNINGKEAFRPTTLKRFKILATLDFTAKRRRMTVICSDEAGKLHLHTKGADSTIFRLCNEESKALIQKTRRHVTTFAKQGSRTLVMAWKPINSDEYVEFEREFRDAEVALNDRDDKIEKAFGTLEHSLFLLGATAVEDQMQEGVAEAVGKLKEANIKVVMLTGDKQETAVSIGRQSGIIGESIVDSELMKMSARAPQDHKDLDALERQMRKVDKQLDANLLKVMKKYNEYHQSVETAKNGGTGTGSDGAGNGVNGVNGANASGENSDDPLKRRTGNGGNGTEAAVVNGPEGTGMSGVPGLFGFAPQGAETIETALVLNGDALEMCLHPDLVEKFIRLFEKCSTIVCNRANPAQKAMLVSMAKKKLDGVALAIGDGANDVSMIQASNVGIGIMGKEGTQAALASDFVIHRFRHLIRLLYVHGRFSFLRTAQLCLISLYKNMAFNMPLAYFAFYSLFTAQTMFDSYMMSAFNMLFTAAFPLCVGAFERDISPECAQNHPKAYYYFKVDSIFNLPQFGFWMFTALWQSLVCYYITYGVVYENKDIWEESGKNGGIWAFGTQMLTAIVIIISLKMMAETREWNWTYYVATAGGLAMYFAMLAVMESWLTLDPDMYYVMNWTYDTGLNWLGLLLQCVICLLPGLLWNLYKREKNADLSTVLYEADKFGYLTINGEHRPTKQIVEDYIKR